MKKHSVKLIFIFSLFSILFFSCANKSKEEFFQEVNSSINNYMYTYTLNCLIDENENNLSFMPYSMKNLLNRNILKDGVFYSVFDLMYPGRINDHNTLYFYDLYNDDCQWVDSMIMGLEEQRIANQLLEMEQHLTEVTKPVNEIVEEKEAENKEAAVTEYVENEVITGDKNLGYMEYGDEKFIPQKIGDKYILIHSYKDDISRNFYDNLFRCYKTEKWNISSGSENLICTTTTNYKNDSYIPISNITELKDSKNYKKFNADGQVIEEKEFYIIDNKEIIKSSLNLKYNSDKKVKESNLIEYTYKDEKYSKLSYSFNKKYVYTYNKDDIPANFDYYENNILKMRNKYFSDDTYTSQIFFDEGHSVTTYYQNNMPVKEIFSINDRVERVNTYEQ